MDLKFPKSLQTLILAKNKITEDDLKFIPTLENLDKLDLSKNDIKGIKDIIELGVISSGCC